MRRKDRVRAAAEFAGGATTAGAAWLGTALLVSNPEPTVVLGVAGAAVLLIGGVAARTRVRWGRALICVVPVVLARLVAGPGMAILVAIILAAGWGLQIRRSDALLGLAVFGAGAAAVGMSSLRLFAGFWALGACTVATVRLVRRLQERRLSAESSPAVPLAHEN